MGHISTYKIANTFFLNSNYYYSIHIAMMIDYNDNNSMITAKIIINIYSFILFHCGCYNHDYHNVMSSFHQNISQTATPHYILGNF